VRKELLRQSAFEKGQFLRRIDRDRGVGGDHDFQSGRVIAMALGDHDGVEARQVHSELLEVAREDARIIARSEEHAPSAVLDERSEPPVFLQCRRRPEGVVENRDPRWLLCVGVEGSHRERAGDRDRRSFESLVTSLPHDPP
jgi:hypothetical protein